jgi:hypothetical protein
MHGPRLLSIEGLGAGGENHRSQAAACADQHGLRDAKGRQPGVAAQQVHCHPVPLQWRMFDHGL